MSELILPENWLYLENQSNLDEAAGFDKTYFRGCQFVISRFNVGETHSTCWEDKQWNQEVPQESIS